MKYDFTNFQIIKNYPNSRTNVGLTFDSNSNCDGLSKDLFLIAQLDKVSH